METVFKLVAFCDGLGLVRRGNSHTIGQDVQVSTFLESHLSELLKAFKISVHFNSKFSSTQKHRIHRRRFLYRNVHQSHYYLYKSKRRGHKGEAEEENWKEETDRKRRKRKNRLCVWPRGGHDRVRYTAATAREWIGNKAKVLEVMYVVPGFSESTAFRFC